MTSTLTEMPAEAAAAAAKPAIIIINPYRRKETTMAGVDKVNGESRALKKAVNWLGRKIIIPK
jgi:hypothetical protein